MLPQWRNGSSHGAVDLHGQRHRRFATRHDERAWNSSRKPVRLRTIPPGIWALNFVSLLVGVSSETIHALLPIYLVTVMGASMVTVGIIEGIAEATAAITKVFSGALSDWLGKREAGS